MLLLERDAIEPVRCVMPRSQSEPGRTRARRRVDQKRLAIVKDRLGNMLLSTITLETIKGFQAKRKLVGTAIAGSTWTSARALRHAAASRHRQ
jgi:hypothetical protein